MDQTANFPLSAVAFPFSFSFILCWLSGFVSWDTESCSFPIAGELVWHILEAANGQVSIIRDCRFFFKCTRNLVNMPLLGTLLHDA